MTTLAERLRAALERNSALSQAALARACGVSTASVSDWCTGETKSLRSKNLRSAALYLGCSRDWLETGLGLPGWTDTQHTVEGRSTVLLAREMSHPLLYAGPTKTAQVSVKGKLEMGDAKLFLLVTSDKQPIGAVDAASTSPNSFALQVVGDHLYPAARHGSCLVVEPGNECVPGELVLTEFADGLYMVYELVLERIDSITVVEANGAGRKTIPRSTVASLSPVTSIVMASKFRSA